MQKIDPDRTLFDLIALDGAADVQNTGILMEQLFPRHTVIVRLDHTVSLLFEKVMALRPINCPLLYFSTASECIRIHMIYLPCSVQEDTQGLQQQKALQPIHPHPLEYRMGGEALQCLGILFLKDTFMESVMNQVFIECKKFQFIGQVVKHG
jgi:hypothetical protein